MALSRNYLAKKKLKFALTQKKISVNIKRSVNFEMSFWYLQFSQKNNEIIRLEPRYHGSKVAFFFFHFLGELKILKRQSKLTDPIKSFIFLKFFTNHM